MVTFQEEVRCFRVLDSTWHAAAMLCLTKHQRQAASFACALMLGDERKAPYQTVRRGRAR